jgi:hypothetical protein
MKGTGSSPAAWCLKYDSGYLGNLVELAEELVEREYQLVGGQGLGEGGEVDNVRVQDAHVVVALQSHLIIQSRDAQIVMARQ